MLTTTTAGLVRGVSCGESPWHSSHLGLSWSCGFGPPEGILLQSSRQGQSRATLKFVPRNTIAIPFHGHSDRQRGNFLDGSDLAALGWVTKVHFPFLNVSFVVISAFTRWHRLVLLNHIHIWLLTSQLSKGDVHIYLVMRSSVILKKTTTKTETSNKHSDWALSLQWRHNERDGVWNHSLDCLLNRMSRRRSKKTSKLRVTGLCEGNPLVTGRFSSQKASNPENVSIWWRHHGNSSLADSSL